ncbi:SURF1-like protein [Novosphingobium colocasiae]|uniref:SURF1-like protein n=1 Tax=Novosphingobium colocasiae TaxID=1256513 RepID=A0A918PFN1_9SPHN|nr:SURF1-like protein [Novosphingobium colocasiae]
MQRIHWKQDLIARVDARVHAGPVDLPADGVLAGSPRATEYLRVRLRGVYAGQASALVRASTELGTGYWAMTPMRIADGRTLWVNRGFVPAGTPLAKVRDAVPRGPVALVGLLRLDEPGGSLLQANRPQDDRWYSRDTAALAQARGIGRVARVFVDVQQERAQDQRRGQGAAPVPGLTVIRFADNHLAYALTWLAMAVLSFAAAWRSVRPRADGSP